MADIYFNLRFYHKGQFLKTKYHCGTCIKITDVMEAEKFSYSVIMEYVKHEAKYTEIGGVYVKKVGGGWRLISNDVDVCDIVKELKDGSTLDLYIDTVVDKAIEPAKQMQPHVIIRPRTGFFEGEELALKKKKYVTIQTLQQEQRDKKKPNHHDQELNVGAGGAENQELTVGAEIGGHDKRTSKTNEFKGNKKKRIEENEQRLEDPKSKHHPASHGTGNSKDKKKKTLEEEWADIDREYVSGHDSLPTSEDEQEQRHKKKPNNFDLELGKSAAEIGAHNKQASKKAQNVASGEGVNINQYEEGRKQRIEENKKRVAELGLKHLADGLGTGNSKKKKKNIVDEESSDREYVEGHDSSETSEDDQEPIAPKRKKKVQKRKAGSGPTTRSKMVYALVGTEAADGEILPPPPPLPTNLEQFKQIKRPFNNGIGTMASYLEMQKRKRDQEVTEKEKINELNDEAINENPDNTITLPTDEPKIRRKRGPTKMTDVFARALDKRPTLTLNHELQPVSEDGKIRAEFSSFLGAMARQCVPLDYVSWLQIPEEEKTAWWKFIKTKYIIPEEGKDWVLKSICESWRVRKSRFKARYYSRYETDEERIRNRSKSVPLEQFKTLLRYWADEDVQKKAERNANNRRRVKDPHNAGRTSFAQIRNDMKKGKATSETPTKKESYPKTRKGRAKQANADGSDDEMVENGESSMEVDFADHGPNWLVGRSGITRKTKRSLAKNDNKKAAEKEKIRQEISAEIEEKMNQKLKTILGKIAEENPTLKINVEELCDNSVEEGDKSDGEDGEDADA